MSMFTDQSIRILVSFFSIMLISINLISAQPNGEGLVLGKTYRIQSQVLNEERQIYVYLPDGYRQSEEKYPVAYLMDGYEHFHYTSGIIKALSGNNKIPQMIVIGVLNVDRYRDFTPYPLSYFPNSGHADKFTQFLEEELFPYVEKYYRTEPHRLLIGHSLGGLFAINTLAENSELFNSYIAGSPALLHIDSVIAADYPSNFEGLSDQLKSLYFTIGGQESGEIINCTTSFRNVLLNNAPASLRWEFNFMEEDNHTSLTFSSIYNGLVMIYTGWEVPPAIAKKGFDSVAEHYKNLSRQFEYDIPLSPGLINAVGKRLINLCLFSGAINLLTRAVEEFPKSASLHNNLGVAYEHNKQLDLAKSAYESACDKAASSRDPYYSIYVENLNNLLGKLQNKIGRRNYEAQLL